MRSAPPERVGEALGYVEAARGLGLLIGPLLGGILFRVGGYWAPGVASGTIILAVGLLSLTLPTPGVSGGTGTGTGAGGGVGFRELCGTLRILTNLVMTSIMFLSFSFLDPILAPYLEAPPYNLTSPFVGLMFTFCTVPYIITSVTVAPIARKAGETGFVVIGRILLGSLFLLLGPSHFLPFLPQKVYLFAGTMALFGVVIGGVMVPGQTLMANDATKIRGPNTVVPTEEFSDALSALTMVACTGGSIAGPLIAGGLTEVTDFQTATTILAFFVMGLAVVSAPILCWRKSPSGLGEGLIDNESGEARTVPLG
uniref:Major facilitator superfamily (MFS) profile domain-containing protein n=1 Tax=Noctiluca scintillans TaxID=2966 RepID=A0A7S1F9L2_NOCSC